MIALLTTLFIFFIFFISLLGLGYWCAPKKETLSTIAKALNFQYHSTKHPYLTGTIDNKSILIQKTRGPLYPAVTLLWNNALNYRGTFSIQSTFNGKTHLVIKSLPPAFKPLLKLKALQTALKAIPTDSLKGTFEIQHQTIAYIEPRYHPLKTIADYKKVIHTGLSLTYFLETYFFDT
jgi:hypothetical protein